MSQWNGFEILETKPKLIRNQKYINPSPSNTLPSDNTVTNNLIEGIVIIINGEKYGLYKMHVPTKRNGGKRHNKKRRTRKN